MQDSHESNESQKIFRLSPQNDKMLDCHENPCGFSHNDGVGNRHDSAMPNLAMTKMATCHESTSTDSRNSQKSNTISHESRANLAFLRKIKNIRAYIPKDILERKAQEKREVIFIERYAERAKGDFKIAPNSAYSEIFQAIKRAIKRNIDEFKRAN